MKIKDRIKELRRVKASELVPNHKNWRTHPTKQKDALKGVLSEIGYADALLARELPDGSLMLLDGHLRAETTPEQEVPVLVLDLTEEEGDKLLATLDPLASLAEQDDEKLAELLESIETENEALQDLLNDLAGEEIEEIFESGENDDSIPEVNEKPVSKRGEIYKLGNHRLMCGDSTSEEDFSMLMNGERADIAFTSPPYNAGSINQENNPTTHRKYGEYDDEKSSEEYLDFLFKNVGLLLKYSDEVFYNVGLVANNKREIIQLIAMYLNNFKDMLYWEKTSCAPVIQAGCINNLVEFIIAFGNNATRKFKNAQFSQGSYWNVIKGNGAGQNEYSNIHKATFPLYLPVEIIRSFSPKDGKVLDCFGGTGTTIIAAEQLGRKCFMMEIDPLYCDVIRKRWAEYVHGEGCDWKALTPAI